MSQRIYHGSLSPKQTAETIISHFHRGNYRTQQIGSGEQVMVQIATSQVRRSGGQTALSVTIRQVEDGITVDVGKQAWLGIAASLGQTALQAIRNPLSLIGRLDDIAQDIESLQLTEEIWEVIDQFAQTVGTGFALSERLQRIVCEYCDTANPVGTSNCIACGAPLGTVQPTTCVYCGFVIQKNEKICPNCKKALP
jgi:hypothetical protein